MSAHVPECVQLCLHVWRASGPLKRQRHLPVEMLHWAVGWSLFLTIGSEDTNSISFMRQENQMQLLVAGNSCYWEIILIFFNSYMNLLRPPAPAHAWGWGWISPAPHGVWSHGPLSVTTGFIPSLSASWGGSKGHVYENWESLKKSMLVFSSIAMCHLRSCAPQTAARQRGGKRSGERERNGTSPACSSCEILVKRLISLTMKNLLMPMLWRKLFSERFPEQYCILEKLGWSSWVHKCFGCYKKPP